MCDQECLTPQCAFDMFDCCAEASSYGCQPMMGEINDGVCNPACDIPECMFDGGDCYVPPETLHVSGQVEISLQTQVFAVTETFPPTMPGGTAILEGELG